MAAAGAFICASHLAQRHQSSRKQHPQRRSSSRRAPYKPGPASCSAAVAGSLPLSSNGPWAEERNWSDATETWASFVENVSGEWEGVTASFGPDGEPLPLPEYYVPQAYRDWGVEIHDWQSQSSMLGNEDGLMATNRRMMPTVGCEADAIAYTQAAGKVFEASSYGQGIIATVAPDGSYTQGPPDMSAADCTKAVMEQCLVVQPRQRRLRVVHNLQRMGDEGGWALESVELHNERYDSPYRGKVELSGCGGGMKAFAGDQRLAAEAVQGCWNACGMLYAVDEDSGQSHCEVIKFPDWPADKWAPGDLLLHPLQAWSSCHIQGNDVSVAAGVMLDEEGTSMAVATRRLVAGRFYSASLLTLVRQAT